jgi:hypothetical protein
MIGRFRRRGSIKWISFVHDNSVNHYWNHCARRAVALRAMANLDARAILILTRAAPKRIESVVYEAVLDFKSLNSFFSFIQFRD